MALNIKNAQVERLAAEVAELAGETKTEAIRRALAERKERLRRQVVSSKKERLVEFLEKEIWPLVPPAERKRPIRREKEDEILGFGPQGF